MKNGKIYFKNCPDIWQQNKTLAPDAVTYQSDWSKVSWRFSLSKNNISPAAPDLELILFPL